MVSINRHDTLQTPYAAFMVKNRTTELLVDYTYKTNWGNTLLGKFPLQLFLIVPPAKYRNKRIFFKNKTNPCVHGMLTLGTFTKLIHSKKKKPFNGCCNFLFVDKVFEF